MPNPTSSYPMTAGTVQTAHAYTHENRSRVLHASCVTRIPTIRNRARRRLCGSARVRPAFIPFTHTSPIGDTRTMRHTDACLRPSRRGRRRGFEQGNRHLPVRSCVRAGVTAASKNGKVSFPLTPLPPPALDLV